MFITINFCRFWFFKPTKNLCFYSEAALNKLKNKELLETAQLNSIKHLHNPNKKRYHVKP